MIVALVTQQVKDQIQDVRVYVPEYGTSTHINCVPDCNYNWITSILPITAYNNIFPESAVEFEEVEHCPLECDDC